MNSNQHNLIGGFAGAVVLNIIHETLRRFYPDAPRIDLIGEQALSKLITGAGGTVPEGKTLYASTLGADLISNAAYFSLIGTGDSRNIVSRGLGLGLAAGVGAMGLTKPLGLDDEPVTKTTSTKLLTCAYYAVGGLVSALVIKKLRSF
jgi:hypothetical protein